MAVKQDKVWEFDVTDPQMHPKGFTVYRVVCKVSTHIVSHVKICSFSFMVSCRVTALMIGMVFSDRRETLPLIKCVK